MYRQGDIHQAYKMKLITADKAAQMVESGMRLHFGTGLATVHDLDEAIARRADELTNLEITGTVAIRKEQYKCYQVSKGVEHIRFSSAHLSGGERKMCQSGNCWYIPMNFNELPSYWGSNGVDIDIAMIEVCPMDKYGNFNLGPQVTDLVGLLGKAKKIILEVNENMPVAYGIENTINIADIDFVVEGSNHPLTAIPSPVTTEIDRQIASFVVEKIQSNSTLQLGIGGLPSTIGTLLSQSDVTDISCHTEMLVDGYLELFNSGKLTNKKRVNRGKIVYSFAGGSQDLYDFIDGNQICYVAPVDYVNNQGVIASMDNFVSVNSAINVDLYGQVCSEMFNYRQISGTGGQLDFVMGAYHSKGGQSFICLPSSKLIGEDKKASNVVSAMAPGNVITTPRNAVHNIVTEYGVANLKGKSTWERAELLINISHPDFRDDLIKEAEKMGIWTKTSKISY